MSRECPEAGARGGARAPKTCFKCGKEDHISRDCPAPDPNYVKPKTQRIPGSLKIVAGNLPFSVTEEQLRDFFKGVEITDVHWFERDGTFMGMGFLTVGSEDSLTKALAKNGLDFGGRAIRVDYALK